MKIKSIAGILFLILSVTASFFLGESFSMHHSIPSPKTSPEGPALISNLPLINPFIDCIEKNKLCFNRLSPFKKEIEQYLKQAESENDHISVSYYFLDLNNGMRIMKGEQEKYCPASLMKVPVMMAILKKAETDPTVLGMKLQYSKKEIHLEEESGFEKMEGNYYSVNELLIQSIQYSDNAASLMLRRFVGEDIISKTEDELGVHVGNNLSAETSFLTVDRFAGIFYHLYECDYLNTEMSQLALNLLAGVKYNSGIRKVIPQEIPVAQKYGKRFSSHKNNGVSGQLHQFGLIYFPGRPFILGIMTKGGEDAEREKIIEDLSRITYDELKKQSHSELNSKSPTALLSINKIIHSVSR